MNFKPMPACGAAAAAALLSALIGIVGRVPAGILFFRAFLFAVIFFIFSAAASVVFAKLVSGAESVPDASPKDAKDEDDNAWLTSAEARDGKGTDEYPPQGEVAAEASLQDMQVPSDPLEQNNTSGYTEGAEGANPSDSAGFSPDFGDFVPGLPGVADEAEETSSEDIERDTVEISVGAQSGKKIALSDLGADVDGKKVAKAIQTLLKKDEE